MARIKNETVYPRDTSITGQETVIGSDTGGGTTKNYTVDDLATYIQTNQTNIVRLFHTKKATASGIAAAVIAVNTSNEFTVANQDVACVVVQRNETTITNTKSDEKIWYDYYWLKDVGEGTYGVGGTIVITADNLEFRKSTEIYTIQTNDNLPPVVYELTTEDISTPPEEVVNITTVVGGYLIDSNADYFFEIREVEYNNKGVPIFTGNIKYYRFVGADGTYGNGFTATVNGDFILLSSNDLGITEGTYLSLTDTIDTTYEGKDDWVPAVYANTATEPTTRGLKLKPVVTLPDLFRPNAAVEYGVTHISGLTYYVYVNKFIIDGIDYNIFASDTITLSNGDVTNNRIDVIVARINPLGSINPTIEVLEGTPAGSPVEESINLLTEVKLSVKLVLANETTDPNVTSDMVYNENTEWTNSSLAAGADLDDTTSPPYIGSKSLNVPAIGGTGDSVIWDKGSSATFDVDDRLIFALKETGITEKNTSITIKLIDISSGGYWLRTYYINKLKSRGFDEPRGSTWNLVNIPFTDFVPTTISMTTYDRIEFSIKNSSELDFDWIHVQGGIDHEDPTTDISFIGLIDTPTNYEGGASKVVSVKSDESGLEFVTAASSTGLEALDEGSGIGWRLIGKDPDNFGNIGLNAVDLSDDFGSTSSTRGAINRAAVTVGIRTTASGQASFAGGQDSVASATNTFAFGTSATASTALAAAFNQGTASGTASFAVNGSIASGERAFTANDGQASGTRASAFGETIAYSWTEFAVGSYQTTYTPTATTFYDAGDRAFVVGVGSGSGSRADGLTVFKDGSTVFGGAARFKGYTVATLPATPTQGDTAYVTDATAPTYLATLTGGGGIVCPVFYNGVAWVSH